jgi:two-component system response regulator (stage 0 sporulation protein A)
MNVLYSRICEMAAEETNVVPETVQEEAAESVDEQITNLFLTIGIPAHIKGYQYLREAVRMVIDNREVINRITKELYPGIAKKYDTSASKVERAMRHAIEVAWTRGRLDTVNQMYGYKVFRKDDKPTNGELVSCVSELIRMPRTAG